MMERAILGLWLLAAFASASLPNEESANADKGRWKVGDCIMAEFAMTFLIHPNVTDGNKTEVDLPGNARVDDQQKNCQNDSQHLFLTWQDEARNVSHQSLERNLTVIFGRKANASFYGVTRFFAVFEIAKFSTGSGANATNVTSMLTIDSGEITDPMFHTPLDRSFSCADIGDLAPLPTTLTYTVNNIPKNMTGTKLSALHVKFDAFRPKKNSPSDFRTPLDCDYHPNDIIPIAVGVALATLIVVVLVCYMVGRRRVRQQEYLSV